MKGRDPDKLIGRRFGTRIITAWWRDRHGRLRVALRCDCGDRSSTQYRCLKAGQGAIGCACCSHPAKLTNADAAKILGREPPIRPEGR